MSHGFNLNILKKTSLHFNDNADQFNDNAERTTRTQERCQNHPYTDSRAWYYLKKQSEIQHDVSDADKHFFNMSAFTLTYNKIYPTAENRYDLKTPQAEYSVCNVHDIFAWSPWALECVCQNQRSDSLSAGTITLLRHGQHQCWGKLL